MTRTLFDGITAADVPDGWGVAGYIDGNWPDYHALTLRWPAAEHISIAAHPADDAKCLDVENGDATPADAPGWTTRQREAGDPYPWNYCNTSAWPELIYEYAQQKVAPPLWWVAEYDGVAIVPPRAIAKQHTNTPGYDVSAVADYVPGIDPAPQPAASAAHPEEDDDMTQAQNGYATLSWPTGSKHVVQVAFDSIGGNAPDLRAVLLLESGPLVLAESWKPTAAARVIEFPDHAATAYGLELQPVGTPARYAAIVA